LAKIFTQYSAFVFLPAEPGITTHITEICGFMEDISCILIVNLYSGHRLSVDGNNIPKRGHPIIIHMKINQIDDACEGECLIYRYPVNVHRLKRIKETEIPNIQ